MRLPISALELRGAHAVSAPMQAPSLLAIAAVVFTLTPTTVASACINEVQMTLTPVQQIALAENLVGRGDIGEAASRVRAMFPQVRTMGPEAPPLGLRAQRIYALALVRADGQLDGARGWARSGNVEWAVETLRALDAKRPNDPRSQADLAEARTLLARTREAAIAVLESLDQRDLLGSAYAYVALARARGGAGDDAGAQAALRRCAAMSSDRRRCQTVPARG